LPNTIVSIVNNALHGIEVKQEKNLRINYWIVSHQFHLLNNIHWYLWFFQWRWDIPFFEYHISSLYACFNLQCGSEPVLETSTLHTIVVWKIVESLKAMFHTPHVLNELRSLNYGTKKIENVSCLPTKFNGDIFFELSPICH